MLTEYFFLLYIMEDAFKKKENKFLKIPQQSKYVVVRHKKKKKKNLYRLRNKKKKKISVR